MSNDLIRRGDVVNPSPRSPNAQKIRPIGSPKMRQYGSSGMAEGLLTLLGAAGESLEMDRVLQVNTSKQRQWALFRQGTHWYTALPNMRPELLIPLMEAFAEQLAKVSVFQDAFGVL